MTYLLISAEQLDRTLRTRGHRHCTVELTNGGGLRVNYPRGFFVIDDDLQHVRDACTALGWSHITLTDRGNTQPPYVGIAFD